MPATMEELLCHLVTGEVVDRAKAHQYQIVALSIYTQGNGQLVPLDAKRIVDKTFEVALDEMKTLHVSACHTVIRGMQPVYDTEALIHGIATEAYGREATIVEDIAIDLVFIYALGEQLTDYEIDGGISGVVGEAASVGHHSAIHTCSPLAIHLFETTQLPDDAEHQLAGTAHMWMRNLEIDIHTGCQMVVDHHLAGTAAFKHILHLVETARAIEIETEHEVGFIEGT